MIRALLAAGLAASLLLSGCTVPVYLAYAEVCTTETVGAYVGQPYTDRIGRIVKDKTRSFHFRTLAPDAIVTQEFNAKRVNVVLDERNRVSRIYCG